MRWHLLVPMLLLAACGGGVTTPEPDGPRVTIHAGNNQEAEPGSHLPGPLRLRVVDGDVPVAGLPVSWQVVSGGGSLQPLGTVTDAQGIASALLVVGPAGPQVVEGRVDGAAGVARFTALSTLNPATGLEPVAVVSVPATYGHHDTFVRDGLAFVSAWNAGVRIYDVGNGIRGGSPGNPVLVSQLVTSSNGVPGGPAVHNAWWFHNPVSGEKRYLFIGQEGPGTVGLDASGDLHVVDVSDLTAPQEVATLRVPGAGVHNFWMDEARQVLYAAWYNGGVVAVNVAGTLSGNLANRIIATVLPGGVGNTYTWGVMLAGNTLYAADMLSGLVALDPLSLQPRHAVPTVTDRWTSDLWIHGAVAYTGTWGSRGGNPGNQVKVWSLGGNGVPQLVRSLAIADVSTVSDVAVSPDGRWLVVTGEGGLAPGLYLFARDNPLDPRFVSYTRVAQGLHTGEVKAVGGRTYVFAARNPPSPAMLVYDITDVE